MFSLKRKILPASLVGFYPLVSTFLMTLVWQILQNYCIPFMGVYFFSWVQVYAEVNPAWLSGSGKTLSQIFFSIYLIGVLACFVLSLLACFRRKGKAVCLWILCGIWSADLGFLLWDMFANGVYWQQCICLGEHLIFLAWALLFSLFYLKAKQEDPEYFKSKKQRNYRSVYR